jgi:hypothetical protein
MDKARSQSMLNVVDLTLDTQACHCLTHLPAHAGNTLALFQLQPDGATEQRSANAQSSPRAFRPAAYWRASTNSPTTGSAIRAAPATRLDSSDRLTATVPFAAYQVWVSSNWRCDHGLAARSRGDGAPGPALDRIELKQPCLTTSLDRDADIIE